MPELPLGALTAAASASGLSVPGMEQEPPMKARRCSPGPVQPWPNAALAQCIAACLNAER